MDIIRAYYKKTNLMDLLIEKKIDIFKKHPDIAKEFEYWIINNSYITENAVNVQNYTAEKLSKLSEFLDGESAFMYLINLREEPEKTLERIKEGFYMM